MGLDTPPLMIAAADRRISNQDGSYHSTRLKLFPVPRFSGAISYFGLAAFPQGRNLALLSDWRPAFIRRSQVPNLGDFAANLKRERERVIPRHILATQPTRSTADHFRPSPRSVTICVATCGTATTGDCIHHWAINRRLTMNVEPRRTSLSTEPRKDPGRRQNDERPRLTRER